jgi:hypothetical protein
MELLPLQQLSLHLRAANFAITCAQDVHKWGSTGEGWDGVVWSYFHYIRNYCESDLESERMLLL